jgi:UDP-N-acetylglucosamine transferase subunit ALG13
VIFVTVGASQFPFDRLLRAVDALALDEELVVQHGPSAVRPAGARCVGFLPFDEVVEHVRRARAVVSHGGIGSVLVALAEGKRPLVVPRLARYGETVDDHQVESVRRLDEAGLVTAVPDPALLPSALRRPAAAVELPANGASLVRELAGYIRTTLDDATAPTGLVRLP